MPYMYKQKSAFRLALAPTGRARCRVCRAEIRCRSLRLEEVATVMAGQVRKFCSHAACVTKAQVGRIRDVYGDLKHVPVASEAAADAEKMVARWQETGGGSLKRQCVQ